MSGRHAIAKRVGGAAVLLFVAVGAVILFGNLFPDTAYAAVQEARAISQIVSDPANVVALVQDPPPIDVKVPMYVEPYAAVKRLAMVERFAFGGVGAAGMTSEGEIYFRLILSHEPTLAREAFEKLYAIGNAQGKCYALCGIRNLAPKRFKQLAEASGASAERVIVMRGCFVSEEPIS